MQTHIDFLFYSYSNIVYYFCKSINNKSDYEILILQATNQTDKKPSPSPRTIMHADMDAFFAAIEELDHPEYRGKPVVVGADPQNGHGRGVVSTANYAARKFGIHSALPISHAYKLCPDAVFVRGRHQRYREMSQQVMTILKEQSFKISQISIDEAFVDITPSVSTFEEARRLALNFKKRIHDVTGLTASIGIGPNMFIAKVASDLQKPNGLTICPAGREKAFLKPLPIKRLWGVGPKTEALLHQHGFKTIGTLAETSQDFLAKKMGKWGFHLWQLANGIDHRPVGAGGPRKSISQEHTFQQDISDVAKIESHLQKITQDLSAMMRPKEVKGRILTLKIRLEGFLTYTRRQTFSEYTNHAETMEKAAVKLFRRFERYDKKVRLIGVAISGLNNHGGEQLELFTSLEQ